MPGPRYQKVPRYTANFHSHRVDKRGPLERLLGSETPAAVHTWGYLSSRAPLHARQS
mgnify:CR=1 FL=1